MESENKLNSCNSANGNYFKENFHRVPMEIKPWYPLSYEKKAHKVQSIVKLYEKIFLSSNFSYTM